MDDETDLTQAVKILTLYEPAMFGEMSFLTGEEACASVVAEASEALPPLAPFPATHTSLRAFRRIPIHPPLDNHAKPRSSTPGQDVYPSPPPFAPPTHPHPRGLLTSFCPNPVPPARWTPRCGK